jgi:hypothetical protein
MTLRKAIEVLRSHQSWRLGDDDVHMQKPSVVTEAINTLLNFTDSPEFNAVEANKKIKDKETISDKYKSYQDWLNEVPEISDEEIKQKAYSLSYKDLIISIKCFIKGCEWYREQLKQKS